MYLNVFGFFSIKDIRMNKCSKISDRFYCQKACRLISLKL